VGGVFWGVVGIQEPRVSDMSGEESESELRTKGMELGDSRRHTETE
jgi:hypothetical protein